MSSSICCQSLIPDIKMNQEAVVELHPEELQLSADEDESDGGHDDHDKGLKIRRTVTQVRSPVDPFEELGLDVTSRHRTCCSV